MTRELYDKYNDGKADGRAVIRTLASELVDERIKELKAAMPAAVMSDEDAVVTDRILDEMSFLKGFISKLDKYY